MPSETAAGQSPSCYGVEVLGRHVIVLFLDEVSNLDKPYNGQIREVRVSLDHQDNPVSKHWIVFDDGDDYQFDDLAALEQEGRLQWSVNTDTEDGATKRKHLKHNPYGNTDNSPYDDANDRNITAYKKQRMSPEESDMDDAARAGPTPGVHRAARATSTPAEEHDTDVRPDSVSSRHRVTPVQHPSAIPDNSDDNMDNSDAQPQPEAVSSTPQNTAQNVAAATTPAPNTQQPPYYNSWNYGASAPAQPPIFYRWPQHPAYHPHFRYPAYHNNNDFRWDNTAHRPWGGTCVPNYQTPRVPPRFMPQRTNHAPVMNIPDVRGGRNYYYRLNNAGAGYWNTPATPAQPTTKSSPPEIDNDYSVACTPAAGASTSNRPPSPADTSATPATHKGAPIPRATATPAESTTPSQPTVTFASDNRNTIVTTPMVASRASAGRNNIAPTPMVASRPVRRTPPFPVQDRTSPANTMQDHPQTQDYYALSEERMQKMSLWLQGGGNSSHKAISKESARNVMTRVRALASGQGILYTNWTSGTHPFYQGESVNLSCDFEKLLQDAKAYEATYGEDRTGGWGMRYAIKKLELYQEHFMQYGDG